MELPPAGLPPAGLPPGRLRAQSRPSMYAPQMKGGRAEQGRWPCQAGHIHCRVGEKHT